MNIDDPTKEASSETPDKPPSAGRREAGAELGGDDHVEVLVEDLFIEEYQVPLTLAPERPPLRGMSRLGTPLRARAKSLVGGLLALGGLALATLFLKGRQRKVTRVSRLFHKLGIAR